MAPKASIGSETYDTIIDSLALSHACTVAMWSATRLEVIDATGDEKRPNLHSMTARSCRYGVSSSFSQSISYFRVAISFNFSIERTLVDVQCHRLDVWLSRVVSLSRPLIHPATNLDCRHVEHLSGREANMGFGSSRLDPLNSLDPSGRVGCHSGRKTCRFSGCVHAYTKHVNIQRRIPVSSLPCRLSSLSLVVVSCDSRGGLRQWVFRFPLLNSSEKVNVIDCDE